MKALSIKAYGLVTAVGFNAASSLAAMRAGIRCVKETNLWDAESGEYLPAGRVDLPQWWVGIGKLADLVAPAIKECIDAASIPPTEIPILLGVSSHDRSFRFEGLDKNILGEIEHRLGFQLNLKSRVIPRDHVSVVDGLHLAQQIINNGEAPCCIVAAVDSLVQHNLTNYYLDKRRILVASNSNGFSPGEAGSALLIVPTEHVSTEKLEILGVGMAQEKAIIESEEPLRSEGLTQAISGALEESGLAIQEMDYCISDLNGEHYKFKEMVFAMMRYERKPKTKMFDLWHPIQFIGDVGAAVGPIILALAFHASQKGYAVGPKVLCTVGNDDGARATVIAEFHKGNVAK